MQQEFAPGTDTGAAIAAAWGIKRSDEWESVRKEHLNQNNKCLACTGTVSLQVHHIIPFHLCHLVYRGDLELDERNLMTLCEDPQLDHHHLLGHLQDWKSYHRLDKIEKAAIVGQFTGFTKVMLLANEVWMALVKTNRPPDWGTLDPDALREAKIVLRQFLDANLQYIPTPGYPAPYPLFTGGDDGNNAEYKATTYGPRLPLFRQQLKDEAAANNGAAT